MPPPNAFRCILGVGGARGSEHPLVRAHVGRAFVDHVADSGVSPATGERLRWQSVSSALADICQHPTGVVLCRLWPQADGRVAATQCIKYIGLQDPSHLAMAYADHRLLCGRFSVSSEERGPLRTPLWHRGTIEALSPTTQKGEEKTAASKILRVQIGVATANRPMGREVGEQTLSGKESATILESVFPAAFEWLLKHWAGAGAVTGGGIYRERNPLGRHPTLAAKR